MSCHMSFPFYNVGHKDKEIKVNGDLPRTSACASGATADVPKIDNMNVHHLWPFCPESYHFGRHTYCYSI